MLIALELLGDASLVARFARGVSWGGETTIAWGAGDEPRVPGATLEIHLMPAFHLRLRRPTYQLKTLFLLIAVLSAPLAFWASREHQYRARASAFRVLQDQGTVCVHTDDPIYQTGRRTLSGDAVLKRDDVVVAVNIFWSVSDQRTISALLCFPTVTALKLYETDITDAQLGEIAKLPSIEELDLHETGITDGGVRHLAAHRSMRDLNLSHTRISGAGLASVSSMRSMRKLDLSHTKLSGNCLAHLSSMRQLETLNLEGDEIDGESLRHLAGLGNLSNLDLNGTGANDAGVGLLDGLGSLRRLDLSRTQISGAALAHLSAMQRLKALMLTGDDIEDESLRHLVGLPIAFLLLERTRVTDQGLASLRDLASLEFLALDYCAISDAGLSQFAEMASLETIYCVGTSVTLEGAARLHTLNPKVLIYWGSSQRHAKEIGPDGVVRDANLRSDDDEEGG